MSVNSELSMAHLLSACPVAANIRSKRNNSQISTLGGDLKIGTSPRNGVQLRYYKRHEYQKLSQKEKDKLSDLRPKYDGNNGDKGNGRRNEEGGRNKRNGHGSGNGKVNSIPWNKIMKCKVAALVKAQLAASKNSQ